MDQIYRSKSRSSTAPQRWLGLLLVAIAACTSVGSSSPDRSGDPTSLPQADSSEPDPTSQLRVNGYNFDAADVYVRTCETQLYGGEPLGPTAPEGDRIGPLVLSGLSMVPGFDDRDLRPDSSGELKILKFPTELAGPNPVWLAVSPEDRAEASLIYDSSRWGTQTGRLALSAGDSVVAFEWCDDSGGHTQYNGGTLVAGPTCITFEVWEGDPNSEPTSRTVAFGSGGDC